MRKLTTLAMAAVMTAGMTTMAFANVNGGTDWAKTECPDGTGLKSVTVTMTVDVDPVEAGVNGKVAFNPTTGEWIEVTYGPEAGAADWQGNPYAVGFEKVDDTTIKVTFPYEDEADMTGGQFCFGDWNADYNLTITDVVFNTEGAGAGDAGDVAPVAYLATVLAIAGVAVIASKKVRA